MTLLRSFRDAYPVRGRESPKGFRVAATSVSIATDA